MAVGTAKRIGSTKTMSAVISKDIHEIIRMGPPCDRLTNKDKRDERLGTGVFN